MNALVRVCARPAGVFRVSDVGAAGNTRCWHARWLSDPGMARLGLNRCVFLDVQLTILVEGLVVGCRLGV